MSLFGKTFDDNGSSGSLFGQTYNPKFKDAPSLPLSSMPKFMPAHSSSSAPVQTSEPSLKTAWIQGTLGSLVGRAVTPLVEKVTGKKVDLSTIPQSNTLGQKALEFVGSNLSDLPLWLAGDALVAKPLGALAKTAPVAKAIDFLPKAITPALGTGVKAAATWAGGIAPLQSVVTGENLVDLERQTPYIAAGGALLHGAGQLAGKGIEGAQNALLERKLSYPDISLDPLKVVQDAYRNPISLRDAKAQQLNNTFADTTNNLAQTGPTLARQGLNPGELFNQRVSDAQAAFGRPLANYQIKDVITPQQKAHLARQQELEQVFDQPLPNEKLPSVGQTLPMQGMSESDLLQQKIQDAQGAFGKPVDAKKYSFTTAEQRAFDALQQGIKGAQDFLGSNNLINEFSGDLFTKEAQFDNIKHYTGIDLPKLMADWEKAQKNINSLSPDQLRIGKAAGVIPGLKPRDIPILSFNNQSELLTPNQSGLQVHGELPMHPPDTLKPTLRLPLKPRELSSKPIEQPIRTKFPTPEPLTWTNRENIPPAGLKPLTSITPETLGQLQRPEVPKTEVPSPNNQGLDLSQGIGQEVIQPRLRMGLQTFNDSMPGLPDTMSHIVSKTDRKLPSIDTLRTNAYIKTTDNLHRLNQLDNYVENATGQKLSPEDRSYMLALNSRGAGSITSHILEGNLVNPKGEVIGDSLKSIMKPLKNAKVAKQFDDYLVNKHAITRMRAGETVFPDEMQMTPEKSEAIVKQYEQIHPEFKDMSQKLYNFQNKLAKSWLVDTGIVPPEAFGKWVMDNPHYVPNNRLFSDMEQTSFGGARRGFANQANPVKARTGSQRQIISPLESIMGHTDQYVKVARRNEVMQSLIRNIQKNPEEFKGWAEIIPDQEQLKQGLLDDINKTLQTEGMGGVVEQFNKQFDDIFNAKKQRLDLGNVVTGIVNGEKVHVKINDPLLLDALTNLKPQAQHIVIGALGKVTRVMKNLTTGINPVFGLARNIWRDIPTAYINSKSTNNPITFGKDLLGAIVDVMGNKEAYKSYKAMGGGHAASSVSTGRNALAESKARLLPGYSLKHPFSTALGGLERLNNAVESAPRLAEFKRISKPGDYGSKVKGIYEANDVTTNFNKFGNAIKEADSIFPYLNAAWQGIDKLRTTFRDNPVQAGAKALVSITIPSIMLYELNHNNPAYQQLGDYIKDNNFLIPKGNGTFIKIPKPREMGVMFGSSVERTLRQWQDNDPNGFNRFMETVKTNFMPPTRSILAPMNDIRANKDYMDRPIVSGAVSKLSPSLQFDEKTSEPAKLLGKALNKSPQQIDYLARSYLGGLAQLGLPAMTKNASVKDVLTKQVTADPTYSNDIIGDFYTTKDKIDTSASDAKATGNKSLLVGQQYKTIFNKTNTKLSDLRKEVDKVQASGLSNEEKKAKINVLQIKMLELAKAANDKFKAK